MPASIAAQAQEDREVACPNCNAAEREHCTQPTTTGRREVPWVHSARHDLRIGWT